MSAAASGPVTLYAPSEDDEAREYAAQFADVLNQAGWPCEGPYVASSDHFTRDRFVVSLGHDRRQPLARGLVLRDALNAIGVKTRPLPSEPRPPDAVEVFVNPRPD